MTEQQQTQTRALYRIVDQGMHDALAQRFPADVVDNPDVAGTCWIIGDEYIKHAIPVGAIEEVVGDNALIIITSPALLIPYITATERRVYDDGIIEYTIITTRGTFTIAGTKLLVGAHWINQTLAGSQILMDFSSRSAGAKDDLITLVRHTHDHTVNVDVGETITQTKAAIIMEQLQKWEVVDDREDYTEHKVLDTDGMYYVRASALSDLVRGMGYEFPGTMHKTLDEHLAAPSGRIRVDGKRVSVWKFASWDGEDDE